MNKKYLMLVPLAIPLFIGGKAAVNAIKSKKKGRQGVNDETVIKDDAHVGEARTAGIEGPEIIKEIRNQEETEPDKEIIPPSEEEISIPEEEEIPSSSSVKLSKKIPLNGSTSAKNILTGPRGGKYYFDDAGKKIYLKK